MDPIKLDIPWGTDAVQSSQQRTTPQAETPAASSQAAPVSPEGVPVQPGAGPLRLDIPAEPMDIAPGSQELADEEREMRKQGEFDFWSNQGGSNVLAGVAQHLVGGTLHGLGSIHYNLGKMLQESLQTPVKAPDGTELPKNPTTFPESIQQDPLTKMGDKASDFLGEKLGDPTSPVAPFANMLGRSLGMFVAPNMAYNFMANMGEMGSALARQAQEAGATPEQIDKEAEVGSALGTLQYGPLEATTAVGKLAQALPFKARAALMAGTMGGTTGALTAASKMVENLSAKDFSGYDPERSLMDNVASAGAMGAASGLLTFGLLASLGGAFRASPTNTMAKARWEQIKREYQSMTDEERGRFQQEMVRTTEDTPEARPFEDVLREVQPDAADTPSVVEGEFRDVTPQGDVGQPPVVRPERVEGQHPLIPAPPQAPAPEAPVPQATAPQAPPAVPEAPPAPTPVPEQEGLITNLDGPPQVPVAPASAPTATRTRTRSRVPRNVLTAEYPTTLHPPYAGRGVYLTQNGRLDEYNVGRESTEISSPYRAPTPQVARGLQTILRAYTENHSDYTKTALERYINGYLEAHESGHVIPPAVLRRDLGLLRIIAPNNVPESGLTAEGLPEGQYLLRARDYAGRMQTWMGDTGPDARIPHSSWVIFRNPQLRQNLQALYSAWQRAPEGSIQRTNLENAFQTSIHMRAVLAGTHPSAVRRGIQAVRDATGEVDIDVRTGDVADGIFDIRPKAPLPTLTTSLTRTTRTGQRIATEGNRPVILRSTLESMIRRPDVRKADKAVIEKILAESPGVEQYPKADVLVKLHEALPEYESVVLSEANYDRARDTVPGLTDEGNYIAYGYYGTRSGVQSADARLQLLFSRQLPEAGANVPYRHFSRRTVAFNRFFDKGAFREVVELQLGNPLSVWKQEARRIALSNHYAGLPYDLQRTEVREFMWDAQKAGVTADSLYVQELARLSGGTPQQILNDIQALMPERHPVDAVFDQAAHRLLIQEALRKARADGMTSVRFPTGGSVALAEGWGSLVLKRVGDTIVFRGDALDEGDRKLIGIPDPQGRELLTNLALKTLKDGEYGLFPRVEDGTDLPAGLAVITAYVRDFESLLLKEYGATRQYREFSVLGSLGDEYTTKFPTLEVPVTKGPEETVMFFSGIPIGPMLNNLVRWMGLRRRTILQAQQDVDHFNWWNDKTVTLYTLRKLNPHIPQLEKYVQGAEAWNHLRSKWIDRGDSTLREWNKKDGFTQDLATFLFERDDKSAQLGRRLDPQETADLARTHNLDQDQLDLVARIDSDFTDAIETVRAKSLRDVQRLFAADPVTMGLRVQEVNAAFDAMREHNYFPHARFGKYRVYARATQAMTFGGKQFAQGDLILSEFFESEGDQKEAFSHYRSVLGANATVKGDMIPKELSDVNGMPRQMMEVFERDLNLTAAQTKILRELTHKYAPTNSFAKRLMARKNDLGYSMDASRAYAQYMTRFASFIARAEYAPQLADIIKEVKDTVSGMSTVSGANRRVRIHDWLVDHREYLLTPGNELANIRAWTFLWYMAFLPKSMLVNATQIATALFPRLADEYGDVKAGAEIALATRMALRHFRKRTTGWDPRLEAALQQLQEENKLDQSLATQAAAVADGRWMSSLSKNKGGESAAALGGALAFWGGLGFQLMEGFNRRVAAIAAWKLEMARSGSDVLAYKAAKAAIDDTQYDYSRLNRPRYMRGTKSVLTVFWQYPHNFMSGLMGVHGRGTAARMWAILAVSAGVMGLPGADWATGMADFLRNHMGVGTPGSTKADFHKWVRDEVGSHVQLIHDHPDLVAHGASRYGFGVPWLMQRAGIPAPVVDLSGSMSMGQWPPGAELLTAKDQKDFLAKFSTSIGGASLNIPAAALNALYSDDPSLLKRLEMASPNIVRALLRGGRYAVQGTETNSLGDPLIGMTPEDRITRAEALATAMGFGLQRLNENRELSFLAREQVKYMTLRKSMLVQDYVRARTPEEKSLAREEVVKYNRMVSDMGYGTLAIRGEDIRGKARGEATRKAMAGMGLPEQRSAIPVFRDIRGTEPTTPQTPPAPVATPERQKPIVLFEAPVKPPSGK